MQFHRLKCFTAKPWQPGFTLVELLVTLVIVAILASAALPLTQIAVKRAKESELKADLRQIRSAIDAYKKATEEGRIQKKVGDSGYPPTLDILAEGAQDLHDAGKKRKLRFLRSIPRDPMQTDAALPAAQTWGKRSYDSEADSPIEGIDVFDVYSLSEKDGINGVPYREW